MNSPSASVLRGISFMAATPLYRTYNTATYRVQQMFYALSSAHLLQLVDHARDHRQSAVPEFGILGVEPEWLEQLGIMLGAAGGGHRQLPLGKTVGGVLVDRVERVH